MLATIAAQSLYDTLPGSPSPGADIAVEWDASRLPTGVTLTAGNFRANNTGANNLITFVVGAKPILQGYGRVYWEYAIINLAATANALRVGAVVDDHMPRFNVGSILRPESFSYSSNGAIIRDNVTLATVSTFTTGNVLQFVYDTFTGAVYIGRNGTWFNDPASNVPTLYTHFGSNYYPAANVSDNGDIVELRSIASQFSYPVPSNCRAYGADLTNYTYQSVPIFNPSFETGNVTGWTSSSSHLARSVAGAAEFERGVFRSAFAQGSGLTHVAYIDNESAVSGTLTQRLNIDSKFNSLVDNGEYTLVVSCKCTPNTAIAFASISSKRIRLNVRFYDGSNNPIGSIVNGLWYLPTIALPELIVERFNVPALARSFDFQIENEKIGGNFSAVWLMDKPQAGLLRKRPTVQVNRVDLFAANGKSVNTMGVRRQDFYAIPGKPDNLLGVRRQDLYSALGRPLNILGVRRQDLYAIIVP